MLRKRSEAHLDAGGCTCIGTERHESRRIDNQLRGRSGRQGDPGRSKFYLSLEDDLMRIFGSDRMDGMLQKLGLQEGEAITHPWINKALEKAQQKVEARNFDSRKYVLKYDDVMNDQRKVIFEQRIDIMGHEDVSETVARPAPPGGARAGGAATSRRTPTPSSGTRASSRRRCSASSASTCRSTNGRPRRASRTRRSAERLTKEIDAKAAAKEAEFGAETMRQIEKMVLLQTLDHLWREHLVTLEHLRQVIGFRSYGQRDPLNEYKSEGLPPVRDHARQPARGGDRPAHAHPEHARGGGRRDSWSPSSCRRCRRTMSIRSRARTSWPWRMRRWRPKRDPTVARCRAARAGADAAKSAGCAQSEGPRDLGQGLAQRGVPVRLGQEIQALPRQARLIRHVTVLRGRLRTSCRGRARSLNMPGRSQ